MKIRDLLPNEPPKGMDSTDAYGELFNVSPDSTISHHFDAMMRQWSNQLATYNVVPSRHNFLLFAVNFLYAMEQEMEPNEVMAMVCLVGQASVEIEEIERGKDFSITNIAEMITPIGATRLENGSHFGMLSNSMFSEVRNHKIMQSTMGQKVSDDTQVRLMGKVAQFSMPVSKLTKSDALRIAYSMGAINTHLGYSIFNPKDIKTFYN